MSYRSLEKQMGTMYPSKEPGMGRILNALVGHFGMNPKHVSEEIKLDTATKIISRNGENIGRYAWVDTNFVAVRFFPSAFGRMYGKHTYYVGEDGEISLNLIPTLGLMSSRVLIEIDAPGIAKALVGWVRERHEGPYPRWKRLYRQSRLEVSYNKEKGVVLLVFNNTKHVIAMLNYINKNFSFTNKRLARQLLKESKG